MRAIRSSDELLQHTGQGDATVYTAPNMDYMYGALQANRADEQRKAAARAARDKEMADQYKYDPESIGAPWEAEHQKNIVDHLNKGAMLSRSGVDIHSPEGVAWKANASQIKQDVAKSKEGLVIHKTLIEKSKTPESLTDDNALASRLNDHLKQPIRQFDPYAMAAEENNPEVVSIPKAVAKLNKELPQHVVSLTGGQKSDTYDEANTRKVTSKFFEFDPKTNLPKLVYDPITKTNQPVIRITPETKKQFYEMDPRLQPRIQTELLKPENKGKSEDELLRDIISPTSSLETSRVVDTSTKSSSGDSKSESAFKHYTDQTQNLNVGKEVPDIDPETGKQKIDRNGKPKTKMAYDTRSGYVKDEIRLSGTKASQPVKVNSIYMTDAVENKEAVDPLTGQPYIGDRNVVISRVVNLPVENRDGKDVVIHNTKDYIDKAHREGRVKYKWFAEGTVTEQEDAANGKTKYTNKVMIPYEQVHNDIDEHNRFKGQTVKNKVDEINEQDRLKQKSAAPVTRTIAGKVMPAGKSNTPLSATSQRAIAEFTKLHGKPSAAQISAIQKKYP